MRSLDPLLLLLLVRPPHPGRRCWWCRLSGLGLVSLKADLEHSVAQGVAVEGLDGHHGLVVVGHGHKAESLALAGLQIADHLHRLNGAEGSEELPQHVLLGFRCEVVHEYAPSGSGHGVAGQDRVGQQIPGQR